METAGRRLTLVQGGDEATAVAALGDDDLMRLARGGAREAFDTLLRRHQVRMLRLAYRYVGDAEQAADVCQNTFVALFRALPTYRAEGKFSSFLYRLLLNQCRMAKRSARAEARALEGVARLPGGLFATLERERQREVERALDTLGVKLREVVLLRYGAELEYAEIAETLAIPLGTVKRRLFDAMAKLREALGDA